MTINLGILVKSVKIRYMLGNRRIILFEVIFTFVWFLD